MKKFNELCTQLDKYISEYCTMFFTTTFYDEVHIEPKTLYLDHFNKMASNGFNNERTYVFSQLSEKEFEWLLPLANILGSYDYNSRPALNIDDFKFSTYKPSIDNILIVLQKHFSPEFIKKESISYKTLERLIIDKKYKSNKDIDLENFPVIRFQEEVGEVKTTLLINPNHLGMQLAFTHSGDYEQLNYATTFFEFNYALDDFNKASKEHSLNFLEYQGFPMYPLVSYNNQTFNITFNCVDAKGSKQELNEKSYKSQAKNLDSFLWGLVHVMGFDLFSQGVVSDSELNKELHTDEKNGEKYDITYYSGKRFFSHPLFDLYIDFDKKTLYASDFLYIYLNEKPIQDEADMELFEEFVFCSLNTFVKPYHKKEVIKGGWYYHPIEYEAGK